MFGTCIPVCGWSMNLSDWLIGVGMVDFAFRDLGDESDCSLGLTNLQTFTGSPCFFLGSSRYL